MEDIEIPDNTYNKWLESEVIAEFPPGSQEESFFMISPHKQLKIAQEIQELYPRTILQWLKGVNFAIFGGIESFVIAFVKSPTKKIRIYKDHNGDPVNLTEDEITTFKNTIFGTLDAMDGGRKKYKSKRTRKSKKSRKNRKGSRKH